MRNALNLISETVGVETLFQLQMAALSNPLSELKLNILKQVLVANNKREKEAKRDERRLLIETEYCRVNSVRGISRDSYKQRCVSRVR